MSRLTLIVIVVLAGCSSPKPKPPEPSPVFAAPMNDIPLHMCLNVQDGDRHVEFDGSSLWLAEEGKPKQLVVEHGAKVKCERFEIIRNARTPSVRIEYRIDAETKVAVALISDASWVLPPTEKSAATWSQDRSGKPVITVGKKQFRP